jgi:hypothetical protein
MRFRKLRITWSVVSLVAGTLIITLWVLSYFNGPGKGYFKSLPYICSRSTNGIVLFFKLYSPPSPPSSYIISTWNIEERKAIDVVPTKTLTGFSFRWESTSFWYVQIPYWFLAISFTVFAALPWARSIQWRFSLRTLLIATTLVAVVLGTIVYATRQ